MILDVQDHLEVLDKVLILGIVADKDGYALNTMFEILVVKLGLVPDKLQFVLSIGKSPKDERLDASQQHPPK
jgi:hypothetical protein